MTARRTERLEVRITPEGKAHLAKIAKDEERTLSDMVRILLTRGVEATQRKGNR